MKTTKKICYVACFVALFILLDRVSVMIPGINVRITTRNLPLYVGAYVFGPKIGALIGLLGMIVSQFNYSLDLMWIVFLIPQTVVGYLSGVLTKKNILNFENKNKFYFVIMIVLNIVLSLINTICIFIRYLYLGSNFNAALIKSITEIPFRLLGSIITAIVYAIVMPYIVKLIKNLQ